MARIVSIDYGTKRCGLAATDPLQIAVNGLTTINTPNLLDFVLAYCRDNEVEKIVLGLPLFADGGFTELSLQVKEFESKLIKLLPSVKIDTYNERGSSKEAFDLILKSGIKRKKRRNKALLDQMSAVIILQKYLGHL